jgi:Spy/CpxP family protein refolding chaperone
VEWYLRSVKKDTDEITKRKDWLMKNLGIVMGCVLGMTMIATANEPAEPGARPNPPARQARGEMRDGGDMMMLMRPMVIKQLELTSAQQSQIADVVNAATNEMSSLRTKMQTLAKKQAELMGAEPIDENAVLQLADEIGKVRSDTAKVQIKQMLAARKILTAEQRLKMREMMKNYLEKSEGRRPGGKMNKGENKPGEGPAPAKAE